MLSCSLQVLVMTPQILLHNLRHRLIKMELIALLVFDECHHAQAHKRHPYAQIMKVLLLHNLQINQAKFQCEEFIYLFNVQEFYKNDARRSPRIFGMTASPIIGKGYPASILILIFSPNLLQLSFLFLMNIFTKK